ncbi:MAG: Asp-tRNA(Asn)/Glu-tRNA(Gln) amidotransferase subunit GatC [Ruminococcus sp.]|nr:Asp-tRNA(Asn)/Glu-tRNA(Gln) amidotransferase subunit GatC [Oscillospiraceae bacterium]MDY4413427.1 Asp-tRNA(Asn)/Glu-tRNA(Gln) amidotransferase subunit GatC [Ruminococcus sp.]
MQITNELVSYVANLSRIKLDENEISEMQSQMSEIVNYMDILNQLDTENIEPLSHIFNITNVMRDDEVRDSYEREEILKNAPAHTEEAFIVPKTVD